MQIDDFRLYSQSFPAKKGIVNLQFIQGNIKIISTGNQYGQVCFAGLRLTDKIFFQLCMTRLKDTILAIKNVNNQADRIIAEIWTSASSSKIEENI